MYHHKFDYFQKSFLDLKMIKTARCRWGKRGWFIVCEVDVISSLLEKQYTLCINYEKYWPPRVWVVKPNFLSGFYPHTYSGQSNLLCLYNNKLWQWNSSCNIVDTIVCWAMAWITYYEYFSFSNKWVGPEASHSALSTIDDLQDKISSKEKAEKPQYLKDYPIRY